ncbi:MULTISPECIES: helix-turn-helix domain-containing protein [Rhizobium/Agrobacterium group]|uniref:IclR family transcriptional regulator n=1 Tax=Rhizobium/Agrobacterium group TaxID=227290 RepID=UPI001ADB4102|nr:MULTISPECIES: helix-turn-helix domain-containing protein [Rhizobium/Agrobacterium group]MBO9112644.1 helix-turn-helix domain-containing protein [Agrobacterium sp. S2/73]QXZ76138.1 helix-turn-helix domain-containing protein [Agrobacterium sp. S7/73]QYA17313.1 helix-turn-helix domain-containing protein [Rhizobium sp. AB2/73]UEQ85570.1 helix-turn-helix domain-containing protein [Rhizobium sp. AB2/73]
MARDARGIQSIEVGGRILSALMHASGPMMLRDLASAANLAPAQCHGYLTSFKNIGLVEQDSRSGFYQLGHFALRLGIGRIRGVELLNSASQAIYALSEELGFMALMVVWGPHGPTIVQVSEGTSPLTLNIRQGTLFSVTGTASGIVFGAYGNHEGMERIIHSEINGQSRSHSFGKIPPRRTYDSAVKKARDLGYAETVGAPIPGISAVSAPVFNRQSKLELVITLIGRTEDMPVDEQSVAVQKLLSVTSTLSENSTTGHNDTVAVIG